MATYDLEEFINYDEIGHVCTSCFKGRLKLSKRNHLYCDELCWVNKEEPVMRKVKEKERLS